MVRHGRASAGWDTAVDPDLDEIGQHQAERVADELFALTNNPLTIVSSPLARCRQTAQPLATKWEIEPIIQNEVAEIMGVTPNGNILHEVDKLSLQRRGTLVQFRDRKTIFNPKKENFLNTPRHKQSINHWEVDCAAATFRLTRMILLDDNGREIINRTYNDNEIRAMPVVRQSAGFQQVDYVCKQQG